MRQYVRYLRDRHIGMPILFLHDLSHFIDLETVDNKIDHGLILIRIVALGSQKRDPVTKFRRKCLADIVGMVGDDHDGFRLIQTFRNKVHCLERDRICDDRVKRQDPTAHDNARKHIQNNIVAHNKSSHCNAKFF